MIVFQIDLDGIAVDPSERDSPISAGVDGVAAPIAPDERMKPEAGQI
jgi:hypothetical protein